MTSLVDSFTSTGHKLFAHQEVMEGLRNGRGQCIVTTLMLTDVCNHTCAFCSVSEREGDSLLFDEVTGYLDILLKYGLKSVILSGGGNPILYKCRKTGRNINDVVQAIAQRGLEIGLITNGMPLRKYSGQVWQGHAAKSRMSWQTVRPSTLDKLTWVRISMSGLDHDERQVYLPDIDPGKTTLGFSYVGHDIYREPDTAHGKVSTPADLIGNRGRAPDWCFEERIGELTEQIGYYARAYNPAYIRLLPNCLEPELIAQRCRQLEGMAARINASLKKDVAFVQYKPPQAPKACLLGVVHPVLATDGLVYPCDSVTLAVAEIGYREGKPDHNFRSPWAICHWSEIAGLYENKLPHSLIHNPGEMCRGCVFTTQNKILEGVRDGVIDPVPPNELPTHVNFV
jgi:hypothetical protein